MKILAIIPARGGSKGLPRKNILNLCGKPMIGYSIEAALRSRYINRVIVSTEDEEIAQIAKRFGAQIPFMRPMELAQDETLGWEPVAYTLQRLKEEERYIPDYLVLLQPTSPLRKTEHIDEAMKLFLEKKERFDSLISVTKVEHPVEWNRLMDQKGALSDFIKYSKEEQSIRQRAKEVYRLNGAIYITKTAFFLANHSFESARTMGYPMDYVSSVDIDTKTDFEWAEFLMKKKKK